MFEIYKGVFGISFWKWNSGIKGYMFFGISIDIFKLYRFGRAFLEEGFRVVFGGLGWRVEGIVIRMGSLS